MAISNTKTQVMHKKKWSKPFWDARFLRMDNSIQSSDLIYYTVLKIGRDQTLHMTHLVGDKILPPILKFKIIFVPK